MANFDHPIIAVKLLIFTVLLTLCAATEFNATTFCGLVQNGTKLKDPGACNTWIECNNGVAESHVCDDDLFYSLQTGKCVAPDQVKCISSNPCAVLSSETGFVSDPLSCNHYYYCSNNVPTLGSCQNNYIYNASSQTCMVNSSCNIDMLPDSYCNIIPEGVFIKDPKSCENYQFCWNNVLKNATCPTGFYFDAFDGTCTQNMTLACDFTNTTATAPIISNTSACQENGQFIADKETCNGYYLCKQLAGDEYDLIHGNCTEGRFFSPAKNGICVLRANIVCNYDRCAGLGYGKITLSNLTDDDCKGYAVCQDGVQIGQGLCPNNEYFDENIQRCTSTVVKFIACAKTRQT